MTTKLHQRCLDLTAPAPRLLGAIKGSYDRQGSVPAGTLPATPMPGIFRTMSLSPPQHQQRRTKVFNDAMSPSPLRAPGQRPQCRCRGADKGPGEFFTFVDVTINLYGSSRCSISDDDGTTAATARSSSRQLPPPSAGRQVAPLRL